MQEGMLLLLSMCCFRWHSRINRGRMLRKNCSFNFTLILLWNQAKLRIVIGLPNKITKIILIKLLYAILIVKFSVFFILCQNVNLKFVNLKIFLFSVNHSPEFENKNFHRRQLIFFEHRSNLQELIWITLPETQVLWDFDSPIFLRIFLLFKVFNISRRTWIFNISTFELFFRKRGEKSKKKKNVNKRT